MVLNGCLSCLIHFQSELILKFRGYILVPSPLFHVFVAAYVFRKHSVLRWLSMIGAILWLHHTKNSRNLSTCENLTFFLVNKEVRVRDHSSITSSCFWLFCTVNHQELPFSGPTHPPLWWRNTWLVPYVSSQYLISLLNSQYIWKWTNANPMKILAGSPDTHCIKTKPRLPGNQSLVEGTRFGFV